MRFLFLVSLVVIISFTGCKEEKKIGKLGIEVPTGEEYVSDNNPYVVVGVFEGSPVYNAGIRPDDIITQLNGVSLKGKQYKFIYENILLGPPGESVTFIIKRDKKMLVFDVVRGE